MSDGLLCHCGADVFQDLTGLGLCCGVCAFPCGGCLCRRTGDALSTRMDMGPGDGVLRWRSWS